MYTFIMDFRGGTYISQSLEDSLENAVNKWGLNLDITQINYLTASTKKELLDNLVDTEVVEIDNMKNVWFFCFSIRTGFIKVNVIKTAL